MLGFPGFDDPETIENQCAGQWVVCLTCHHSISVLGHPETRYWEEVFTPLYLVEGLVQHMHGDWGFSIRLAIQAGSCMITPRSVYWWSLFLCHCTQEHWNRLIARVFSNGADTSPQHKQTNKQDGRKTKNSRRWTNQCQGKEGTVFVVIDTALSVLNT